MGILVVIFLVALLLAALGFTIALGYAAVQFDKALDVLDDNDEDPR